jgi:WD40 repeat protein
MFCLRKIMFCLNRVTIALGCAGLLAVPTPCAWAQTAVPVPAALLHCGSAVSAVAFSPDGKLLAVGTDGSPDVQVWDTVPWRLRHSLGQQAALGGGRTGCGALTFLADGRLATATDNVTGPASAPYAEVRLWNPRTGVLGQTLTFGLARYGYCPPTITSLAASPDGRTLLGAAAPCSDLVCWDVRTKATTLLPAGAFGVPRLQDADESLRAVAFAPDGRTFAARYYDRSLTSGAVPISLLLVWDAATHRPRQTESLWGGLSQSGFRSPSRLEYTPDGALAATSQTTEPGSEALAFPCLDFLDGQTGQLLRQLEAPKMLTCLGFDPATGLLVFGTTGGAVFGVASAGTPEKGSVPSLFPILSAGGVDACALAVSRTGLLATGYGDGTVRVWRLAGDGKWGVRPAGATAEATAPGQPPAASGPSPYLRPTLNRIDPAGFNYLFPADNAPTVTIRVSGSGFQQDAVVLWGGKPLPTRSLSDTELEATLTTRDAVTMPGMKALPDNAPSIPNGQDQDSRIPITIRNPDGGESRLIVFVWTRSIVGG